MKIYTTTVRGAAERLSNAHRNASSMAKHLREALNKAASYKDPNLTDDALVEKRRELAREFRAAGRVDFDKLAEQVAWAHKTLSEYAREHVQLPDDAAALMRAQQKWDQVERRLNAGQDLTSILRTADETTVRAVVEFGPSWVSATYTKPDGLTSAIRARLGETPEDAAAFINTAAYRRLAEVASDPDTRELFSAVAVAEAQVAPAQPWLDASRALIETGGADMLGAALASSIAASEHATPSTSAGTEPPAA